MARARREPEHQHDCGCLTCDCGGELGIDRVIARRKHMGDPPDADEPGMALPCERAHQGAGRVERCAREGAKAGEEESVHPTWTLASWTLAPSDLSPLAQTRWQAKDNRYGRSAVLISAPQAS